MGESDETTVERIVFRYFRPVVGLALVVLGALLMRDTVLLGYVLVAVGYLLLRYWRRAKG